MSWELILSSLAGKVDLTNDQAMWAMSEILKGNATNEQIKELKRRLKEEENTYFKLCKIIDKKDELYSAMKKENKYLREVLDPFSRMAQYCENMSDSASQCVFVGDLRAAAKALKETDDE